MSTHPTAPDQPVGDLRTQARYADLVTALAPQTAPELGLVSILARTLDDVESGILVHLIRRLARPHRGSRGDIYECSTCHLEVEARSLGQAAESHDLTEEDHAFTTEDADGNIIIVAEEIGY
jgi:hypothetical protein